MIFAFYGQEKGVKKIGSNQKAINFFCRWRLSKKRQQLTKLNVFTFSFLFETIKRKLFFANSYKLLFIILSRTNLLKAFFTVCEKSK